MPPNIRTKAKEEVSKEISVSVERVQTGIRIEKRVLKVLKAFAEYRDLTLGDLIEGIVLHAFDGVVPFSEESLQKIVEIKKIYELDLTHKNSHNLKETISANRTGTNKKI